MVILPQSRKSLLLKPVSPFKRAGKNWLSNVCWTETGWALTIKAKDFAIEPTNHNVVDKDLHGQPAIQREHIDNNLAVRKILQERGVQPEQLPAAEDVKKMERRIKADEKKALDKPDKIKKLPPNEKE